MKMLVILVGTKDLSKMFEFTKLRSTNMFAFFCMPYELSSGRNHIDYTHIDDYAE